ncbi:MAG TPA: hypothetical protein P5525_11130 [Candidatus Paceibacterota bacterium]|nr:hypothetical protein [Candidatus Paceibacterota bacterium]
MKAKAQAFYYYEVKPQSLRERLKSLGQRIALALWDAANRLLAGSAPDEIDWRDRLRWWIEDRTDLLHAWCFEGSVEELESALNAELPLNVMTARQWSVVIRELGSDFTTVCVHCRWSGDRSSFNLCPRCGHDVYLNNQCKPDAAGGDRAEKKLLAAGCVAGGEVVGGISHV